MPRNSNPPRLLADSRRRRAAPARSVSPPPGQGGISKTLPSLRGHAPVIVGRALIVVAVIPLAGFSALTLLATVSMLADPSPEPAVEIVKGFVLALVLGVGSGLAWWGSGVLRRRPRPLAGASRED